MAGLRWHLPPETAWHALAENYRQRVERGIYAIAQRWAPVLENEAKQGAPWVDRTGAARAGLHTEVNQVVGVMVEIVLSHGVKYGYWLETIGGGRLQIINPVIDRFAPRIWADVVRMLS